MLDWWLPENVSTYGREIDWLFHLIYYITGVTFILVFVTMLAFLVMYRDRPGRKARYTHGNTTLEIVWTVVPALILVILTLLSVPAWSKIKMTMPDTDFVVQVTAKQFNWQVTYPGPDGKFGTEDDKTLLDEMHVPVNKVVRVILKSREVRVAVRRALRLRPLGHARLDLRPHPRRVREVGGGEPDGGGIGAGRAGRQAGGNA